MRNLVASVCVIALLPIGVFAQVPGNQGPAPAPSPLSRSIASAIAALPQSVGDQEPNKVSDWSRVQALPRGTEIILTVIGGPTAPFRLLAATDSAVFVLKPTAVELPGRVEGALVGIGDQWPLIFSGGMTYAETKGVRVAQDGIFDRDQRVAYLDQVVQRTAREDVSEIRGPGRRKGSKLLAVVGAAGGLLIAAYVGLSMADKYCGASCRDEKLLMGVLAIGLPTGLGLLGYFGGGHTVPGLIYRAPQSAEGRKP